MEKVEARQKAWQACRGKAGMAGMKGHGGAWRIVADMPCHEKAGRQAWKGRRQKAEGRRQKAEGRRQKAEGMAGMEEHGRHVGARQAWRKQKAGQARQAW
jgi:hypothetical protein